MPQRSKGFRAFLAAALAAILATQAAAQSTVPTPEITIQQLDISKSVDNKLRPLSIEITVGLQIHQTSASTLVVSILTLFYKSDGGSSFLPVKCMRSPNLTYSARIPYAGSTDYYFEATPNKGDPISFGGGKINGTNLKVVKLESRKRLAAMVIALVIGIALGGVVAGVVLKSSKRVARHAAPSGITPRPSAIGG